MKTKAFSLLELTVVIAIVLVLASLLAPVFTEAKVAAKITASTSNLRQGFIAIELYRNDWEETTYGTPAQMGLPPYLGLLRETPQDIFKSPCTGMNKPFELSPNYRFLGIAPEEQDQRDVGIVVLKYLGSTALLVDENCNQSVDPESHETTKRFIWVTLDGTVTRRTTKLTAVDMEFLGDSNLGGN